MNNNDNSVTSMFEVAAKESAEKAHKSVKQILTSRDCNVTEVKKRENDNAYDFHVSKSGGTSVGVLYYRFDGSDGAYILRNYNNTMKTGEMDGETVDIPDFNNKEKWKEFILWLYREVSK